MVTCGYTDFTANQEFTARSVGVPVPHNVKYVTENNPPGCLVTKRSV